MDRTEIDAVRQSVKLSSLIGQRVKLKRMASGLIGLCPFHKERTPSFHVSDARGTWKCFGCGERGDCFDWLMKVKGVSFPEAYEELTGGRTAIFRSLDQLVKRVKAQDDPDERRVAHAHGIWIRRQPIAGTLAERYLTRTRALPGPFPDLLGYTRSAYCSVLGEETEALIAPLQDSRGIVTAVQQIFLCRETDDAWRDEKGKRVKRTFGAMQDAAVRLGVPDTVLGLAGSVEDALAASGLYSLPVWATCGEQRMSRVWIPPEVEQVVLFADADEAGMRAAQEAKAVHQRAGKRVTIMMPGTVKDWTAETERRAG